MKRVAYVVSTGVITAIGNDKESCKASLINMRSGISKADILRTYWQDEFPVGEIKATNSELAMVTKANPAWPRTALLSAIAVQEALEPLKAKQSSMRMGFFFCKYSWRDGSYRRILRRVYGGSYTA